MPDQKVTLKVGADTSEMERAFGALIKKIQSDADKLKLSPAATGSGPRTEAQVKNSQLTEIQSKEYAKVLRALEKELSLIKEIGREREKVNRQEQINNIQKATFQQTQRAQGWGITGGVRPQSNVIQFPNSASVPPRPPPGSDSGGIPRSGITSPQSAASFLGIPGSVIGGAVTAIAGVMALEGARVLFSQTTNRERTLASSAFNIQGQGGQRLESFLNGGASQELMFDPQRQQGAGIAQETMRNNLAWYNRPGRLVTHGKEYVQALGKDLGMDWGLQPEIDRARENEQGQIQKEQTEALKNGPAGKMRTALGEKYLRDAQRNLDFQRQTGLSNADFRGSYLPGIQGAGFTDEQGINMSSSIMGAGGSTRSATGNAALALSAQRNLDITNAGSVLGKLSGSLGGSEVTNQAFVKLLAEGTRVGLDGSEYRAENRKFIESAAEIVSQSGTTTSGGIDQVLSQFSRFFGDRTMAGQDAGKSAFDVYRQTSMAQTGPTGAMRAAGMMRDPLLSKLGTFSRASLFNMPIDQLTPDNPAIIAMAHEAGTTPQALIDAQNKVTAGSANKFAASDTAIAQLSAVKKKYGIKSAIGYQGPLSSKSYDEITDVLGKSNIMQGVEHPEFGQNQRLASIYSDAQASGDSGGMAKALEEAKKQQLGASGSGRAEDDTNRTQAEASRLANQLFVSLKDAITPAAAATKAFTDQINELVSVMSNAKSTDAQRAAAAQKFYGSYPGAISPSNQSSSGPPANGGGQ